MEGTSYDEPGLSDSINEIYASSVPSVSQKAAILSLLDFEDDHILAWLMLLRSLQRGYQHLSSSQTFSHQQIDALSLLKDTPDVPILEWLRKCRSIENPATPDSLHRNGPLGASINAIPPLYSPPQHSLKSISESSASSLGPFSRYSRNTSGETSTTSISQGDLSLYFSNRLSNGTISSPSSTSSTSAHAHWCITCDNPKPIIKCDGWKRHMKEHEIIFPCMPYGPVQASVSGPQCSLCDAPSPNQEHLDKHMVHQCITKLRTYTRKANLVKHLEFHGIQDGSTLADTWQISFKKKYFSCGFCIARFDTLIGQLNHIDVDHFRRGDDICGWDMTKVIKGLLSQPGVDVAWYRISACYADLGFSWDVARNRDLQLQLELAEKTPELLARAALHGCTYDWSHHSYDEPGLMMDCSTLPMTTMHQPAAAIRNSESTSSYVAPTVMESSSSSISMSGGDCYDRRISHLSLPQAVLKYPFEPIVTDYQDVNTNKRAAVSPLNVGVVVSGYPPFEGNEGVAEVQKEHAGDEARVVVPFPHDPPLRILSTIDVEMISMRRVQAEKAVSL